MGAAPVGISQTTVGAVRITHIPDGYHRCDPLRSLVGSTTEDWDQHRNLLDDSGRLVMTMGALLIESADGRTVLVDTGFGPRTLVLDDLGMDFWGGRLLRSLGSVGLSADDVDVVVYSHLHIDHAGWTAHGPGGSLTFPRARHLIHEAEWEFWRHRGSPDSPSDADFAALETRLELVDGEVDVVPGVRVVPTPGHTPGHCSFLVVSGADRAVILGDAIHCPLQISHPEWEFIADESPATAVASRQHLLRELDVPSTEVVGAHFTGALFGRVLPHTSPRQVAFDGAAPELQSVSPDATPGTVFAPPLAD